MVKIMNNAFNHENIQVFKQQLKNLWDAKNFKGALEIYEACNDSEIKKHPDIINALGNIYTGLKDFKMAENYYKQALAVDAAHKAAIFNLAALYRQTGQLDLSLQYLYKGIALKPDNYELLYCLAETYYAKEDYLASYEVALKARSHNPSDTNIDFLIEKNLSKLQGLGESEELVEMSEQSDSAFS